MDKDLVEHFDEPAMNLCLYGFLCIFGIQSMSLLSFSIRDLTLSITPIPRRLHILNKWNAQSNTKELMECTVKHKGTNGMHSQAQRNRFSTLRHHIAHRRQKETSSVDPYSLENGRDLLFFPRAWLLLGI